MAQMSKPLLRLRKHDANPRKIALRHPFDFDLALFANRDRALPQRSLAPSTVLVQDFRKALNIDDENR